MRSDQAPSDAGFGGLLRGYRLMAGLSQEELAERSGLSVRAIANMERGRTARPHKPSLRRLADALELPDSGREQLIRASRLMAVLSSAPEPAVPAGAASAGTTGWSAAGAVQQGPPALRSSLPPDTAAFTGRGAEVSRITAALADTGCSDPTAGGVVAIRAIDGMPGVGKTALAVHAAHLLTAQFPDRQLFVDLHGHTPGRNPVDPGDVLADLLVAAGVDPQYLPVSLEGRAALWRDRMAGQRTLLVLDNAATSAQVSPLLPAFPLAASCWLPAVGTWLTCQAWWCRCRWKRYRPVRLRRCLSGWLPAPALIPPPSLSLPRWPATCRWRSACWPGYMPDIRRGRWRTSSPRPEPRC